MCLDSFQVFQRTLALVSMIMMRKMIFYMHGHCMLEKYGLETNKWLERLFKIREKWALVYGRRSFCANMTTTQRSESMNSVLKRYVSYKHNLLQFFQHFDRMIEDRRYKEFKADFRTSEAHQWLLFLFKFSNMQHVFIRMQSSNYFKRRYTRLMIQNWSCVLRMEITQNIKFLFLERQFNTQYCFVRRSIQLQFHAAVENLSLRVFYVHMFSKCFLGEIL